MKIKIVIATASLMLLSVLGTSAFAQNTSAFVQGQPQNGAPPPTQAAVAPAEPKPDPKSQEGDYRTAPVRPDGMISLPLLNDVQAAGLTPMQLREQLTKRLTEYMPNPEVSVIVREVNRFKVSVLGEVRKPGRFDFKSKATVLDAIALAGGLSDYAARSRIVIIRQQDSGATKRIAVNYNKIVSASSEDDFFLQPGDVVVVP